LSCGIVVRIVVSFIALIGSDLVDNKLLLVFIIVFIILFFN